MLTFDNNPGLLQFNILQRHQEVLHFVTTRQRALQRCRLGA